MSVYKACDIRGQVDELSPDLYLLWGQILGNRLEPEEEFLVGGDVRWSTPRFKEALIAGLVAAGVQVVDLGILPTPMVYFAKRHLQAWGCAIVTASHSPPQVNGLKWMLGDLPPTQAEIARMQAAAEAGAPRTQRPGGTLREMDIAPAYRSWLRARWQDGSRPCRVVLDPGNGCWAGRAKPYLQEIFPRSRFVALHDRPDGLFRERNPDSARPEHLGDLVAAVRQQKADLGMAFDGDGDRVAFVDEEGTVLTAEETTWILIHTFGQEWKDQVLVYDLKCSERIPEAVRALGGRPEPQRSGHAFIRARMIEQRALFGAEISGHYFYGELAGDDDGLFTACRLLSHLSGEGKRLSEQRRACPRIFITPDLRLRLEPAEQMGVIEQIRSAFRNLPQSSVDGVRVEFPEGWGLVRQSVTAAELTFRFEGRSAAALDRIVGAFAQPLGDLGRRLQEQYQKEKGERG